jgi:hypothetical protein
MSRVVKWLVNRNRREILAFFGAGFVVIVGALWTAFTYFQGRAEVSEKIEASYTVCVGSDPGGCPPNAIFLRCGTSVPDWARKECSSYSHQTLSATPGGMCGYSVIAIKCTTGK